MAEDARQLVAADLRARGWGNVADDLTARKAGRRRGGPAVEDAYRCALDLAVHLRRTTEEIEVGNAYEVTLLMARVLRRRLDEATGLATPAPEPAP